MATVNLAALLGRLHPVTYEAIFRRSEDELGRPATSMAARRSFPVAMELAAVALTRECVRVATVTERAHGTGAAVVARLVDEMCSATGERVVRDMAAEICGRQYPGRHLPRARLHPSYGLMVDSAAMRLAAGLTLATMAGRQGEGRLRYELAASAEQVMTAAVGDEACTLELNRTPATSDQLGPALDLTADPADPAGAMVKLAGGSGFG